MGKIQLLAATTLVGLAATAVEAGPPVRIGIGIGFGAPYYYRPWGYPYYYGYPYPYPNPYPYVVPAPVVVQSPPIVVQQPAGTVVGQTPSQSYSPAPAPFTAPEPTPLIPTPPTAQVSLNYHMERLSNPDEAIRRESVMELGRTKNERAVDPLAATLAGDRSATVRDAAARALGLIGSQRSLTALINAAQADPDRDVRHSAQFAVEIIRSNLQK